MLLLLGGVHIQGTNSRCHKESDPNGCTSPSVREKCIVLTGLLGFGTPRAIWNKDACKPSNQPLRPFQNRRKNLHHRRII